jgi:hypothetical protein
MYFGYNEVYIIKVNVKKKKTSETFLWKKLFEKKTFWTLIASPSSAAFVSISMRLLSLTTIKEVRFSSSPKLATTENLLKRNKNGQIGNDQR